MRNEFRTLFFVYGSIMILVHFFQKKTQKTPKSDLDLAWDRMKKWVRTQKDFERAMKKENKKGGTNEGDAENGKRDVA